MEGAAGASAASGGACPWRPGHSFFTGAGLAVVLPDALVVTAGFALPVARGDVSTVRAGIVPVVRFGIVPAARFEVLPAARFALPAAGAKSLVMRSACPTTTLSFVRPFHRLRSAGDTEYRVAMPASVSPRLTR